jgi:hypothetical protein
MTDRDVADQEWGAATTVASPIAGLHAGILGMMVVMA